MRSRAPRLNAQLVKIAMMIALLVTLFVMRDRCAGGIDNLFRAYEPATARRDGGAAAGKDFSH